MTERDIERVRGGEQVNEFEEKGGSLWGRVLEADHGILSPSAHHPVQMSTGLSNQKLVN